MRFITTETIAGVQRVPVYEISEIPYTQIMIEANESMDRRKRSYLEIPCAFDIETTNIYKRKEDGKIDSDFRPYAFMYHWQFCIGYRVVFGRTWKEFKRLLQMLEKNMNLSDKSRLVIYVHNLSFEMQFMRKFLNVTDSFCKEDRAPLKIVHNGCIEFRCSAALSNMNLSMFCKNENATFYKLIDTYNYEKIRTPETKLTEEEQGYCYNDVRGLCECIQSLMRFDTLASIPMTSTGYVRRDARNAMKKNKKNRYQFRDCALSADEYKAFRLAFRGGDTHANSRYANQLLHDVDSYDIASSYPASMYISDHYPIKKFIPINIDTYDDLTMNELGKYCYLLHIALHNVECIACHNMPYISLAKTTYCSTDRILDNGRIKKASLLSMWVTDIDLDIIEREYKYDDEISIEKIYCAKAGRLPDEYRHVVMDYYRKKTELKGFTDSESVYMYNRSKNRVNALFGMMCMRIDQSITKYTGISGEENPSGYETTTDDLEKQLAKYYKKKSSFLSYQWGVFTTALSRARLHEFLNLIGEDVIYCDTDSGKILNVEKHKKQIYDLNRKLQAEAEACGAYADDKSGVRHYMGVYEFDGHYDYFKTLGAKKYVVQMGDKCLSTIAGVNKDRGQEYFNKYGIDAFKIGATIKRSGHLVAYYNDDEIYEIEINGCKIETASNLALIDDTYTIGVTDDYAWLLKQYLIGAYDLG